MSFKGKSFYMTFCNIKGNNSNRQSLIACKMSSHNYLAFLKIVKASMPVISFANFPHGQCALNYVLNCPFPRPINFVHVSSSSPIGPRACILSVDMPISAPRPN